MYATGLMPAEVSTVTVSSNFRFDGPPQSIHEWISRMGPMVIRSKTEKAFDRMFQNLGPEPQRRLGDFLRGNEQATTDQAFEFLREMYETENDKSQRKIFVRTLRQQPDETVDRFYYRFGDALGAKPTAAECHSFILALHEHLQLEIWKKPAEELDSMPKVLKVARTIEEEFRRRFMIPIATPAWQAPGQVSQWMMNAPPTPMGSLISVTGPSVAQSMAQPMTPGGPARSFAPATPISPMPMPTFTTPATAAEPSTPRSASTGRRDVALAVDRENRRDFPRQQPFPRGSCFRCGKTGHMARQCRERPLHDTRRSNDNRGRSTSTSSDTHVPKELLEDIVRRVLESTSPRPSPRS